jgi:hypothetical protein
VASGRTGVSEADAYRYQYENSSGTLFHLLGHNENGTFKFPDGLTLNIDSLKNPNNMYIAMSCHSSDFVNPEAGVGIDRAIDFTTGAAIYKYLQNNMASYQQAGLGVSPPQVQGWLNEAVRVEWSNNRTIIAVTVIAVGGVPLVFIASASGGRQK